MESDIPFLTFVAPDLLIATVLELLIPIQGTCYLLPSLLLMLIVLIPGFQCLTQLLKTMPMQFDPAIKFSDQQNKQILLETCRITQSNTPSHLPSLNQGFLNPLSRMKPWARLLLSTMILTMATNQSVDSI